MKKEIYTCCGCIKFYPDKDSKYATRHDCPYKNLWDCEIYSKRGVKDE